MDRTFVHNQTFKDMTHKTIPLYYCDIPNVGDQLSLWLVNQILSNNGIQARYCNPDVPDKLAAVGSVISGLTLYSGTLFWGSGLLRPDVLRLFPLSYSLKTLQLKLTRFAKNPSSFYALRGPHSKKSVMKLGFSFKSIPFGDPAILMPLFYKPQIKPQYKVGVILHFRHLAEHPELLTLYPNVKFINVERSPDQVTSFIDELCQCERIYSSSLHGIILAQAYGIPCRWFSLDEMPIHNFENFKFEDYFLGVRQKVQDKVIVTAKEFNKLFTETCYDSFICDDLKLNLLNAFPIEEIKELGNSCG